MDFLTLSSFWQLVVLLTLLGRRNALLWSRRRRSPPPAKPRPTAIKCGSSAWSQWSECTPFCDLRPKRSRTYIVKKGNKCSTKTQSEDCPARGGCDHRCDPVHKKCYCNPGFILRGKSCDDINECKSNGGRGPCSHICHNYEGTFRCDCNTGYRLDSETTCILLDCSTPQFSICPQPQTPTEAEANLPLCTNIAHSCKNGTKYNSECTLTCPNNYKLALKKSTTKWADFLEFEFRTASSRIICHESNRGTAIWHAQLDEYYCRRSNDPPLAIKLVGGSIKEGLPPGSTVGRLDTSDAQNGQTMVYSVQSHQGNSLFRCNGSVLETSLVFKWLPIRSNLYPVLIRAQDNGSPPMWTEHMFNISVENVNDLPHSIEISKNWVYENASVGTVVGELSAIDDDLSSKRISKNFFWKLVEDNSGNFNVSDNKVTVQRTLNYDTVKLCYIKVACSDLFSSTEKEIPIYVINLIDPPTISLTGNSIAENSKPGTVIAQITSQSESKYDLEFMISESNPNATSKFGLSPHTICEHHENATKFNTTCYVNITVSGQLDYEGTSEYTLQVYVRNNVSSNFIKWNVSVENLNEKPDKLELNGMKEIPEDTKSGIDICFFMVSDPDNRKEMTQNHSCHVVNSAEDVQHFQVNNGRNSLQVKKNKSLNYEMHQSYLVTVRCVDNGVPSLGITRDFVINVTDTDEPIENLTLSNNKVKENAEVGTQVGILDAYDPDIHRPKKMKFSLIDPKYPPFTLQGVNNEIVVVNGSLNFEETSVFVLTVRVTDTAGRYLQMPFFINILDVNEVPTDIKLSTPYMNENLTPGSFISNITMTDEDDNTLTICSLVEDGEERFALNETALVAGGRSTDYENELTHIIKISLSCCDQFILCFIKKFDIQVKDVNEPPTDITIDNLKVLENKKDITIGKITIFDPDTNPDYHCTLPHDSLTQTLKIINGNKTLRLIQELNFEKEQMITFEVICKEKENSSMSFTKQFDLTVLDVNESPSPGCLYPLYVSHEVSLGTALGNLNVTDPDNMNAKDVCQPKQRLTYTIISEENLLFKVLDGDLVKTGQLEVNMTYIIGISVQDDGIILARDLTRIRVKPETTLFNCTVISLPTIGSQITLSSNQMREGSPNASIIGYLEMREESHTEFELMKDPCNSYPFVIEGDKLMLMLSAYTGPRTADEYKVPQYAMVKVKAKDTSSGHLTYTRFAIFIKDDVKTRSLICFSNIPVRLSHMAKTRLGPIIIYQTRDNNTVLTCSSESRPTMIPPHYKCHVKPNLTESSHVFARVNFANALYVDTEMFLRINVSFTEEDSKLDKLVLDLFCWQTDHLFSFAKGRIQIAIAPQGVCENDGQPRNDSLCRNGKSCPEDSLCSKVINAKQRCVPNVDQLFVVLPATKGEEFCKFRSCLQEILRDPKSACLSELNEQRREKRATDNSLYLDTLNITALRKQNKLLLRAAVWKLQDGGQLTRLPRQSLPQLQGSDDVIFITTKDQCDWLKGSDIKCPIKGSESNAEKRSSTPFESPKIQAAVGSGAAILLIVIIIVIVYCVRRRRKQNREAKHRSPVRDFANMAFDGSELKELPPIPKQETIKHNSLNKKKKAKKGKPKYNFKNPVYEEPKQIHNESHIYNEAIPQLATYAEPGLVVEKSNDKAKETKTISNPFYEATDVIPVQKPQDNIAANTYANVSGLIEKVSTAAKEPEYETLPPIQDKKEKEGLFNRLSKNINQKADGKQEFEQKVKDNNINTQTPAVYACVNKVVTEVETPVERKQQSISATKDPHYEELPLPDASEINKWKHSQQCEAKPSNENQQSQQSDKSEGTNDNFNQVQNIDMEIQNVKTKCPASNEHEYEELPPIKEEKKRNEHKYEELPPIKEEKKRKGIFRLSRAKHDFKNSEQEIKPDRKNSANSESNRLSIYSEMPHQNMLNPRDKAKKDNPANKYPFYEELPVPIRDSKKTESFLTQGESQNEDGSTSPVYHVLEQNDENNESGPQYFVLEKPTDNDNKIYKSLHRELDPPSPAYETYRLPQKSGSESGGLNKASNAEGH